MKKENFYIGLGGAGSLKNLSENVPEPVPGGFTVVTEDEKTDGERQKVICYDESK